MCDIAFVVRRIRHTQKEVRTTRDHAHLRPVRNSKNLVVDQHILHINMERNQDETFNHKHWPQPSQQGEHRLGIVDSVLLQPDEKVHQIIFDHGHVDAAICKSSDQVENSHTFLNVSGDLPGPWPTCQER
jgi:hypothetical protein